MLNFSVSINSFSKRNNAYWYYHIIPDTPLKSTDQFKIDTTWNVKMVENPTRGLYVTSYEEDTPSLGGPSTTTKYLLATHLEPYGARRVFPCFDEPGLKAKFDFKITFKYPEEYTAVFNTQPKDETKNGEFQTNTFHTTVVMPTYLLAMVISPYIVDGKVGGTSEKDVQVRIMGRPSYEEDTQIALNEAKSIVDGYSEYFGIDYCQQFVDEVTDGYEMKDLCKSDQSGAPTFSPGAMENWGLILYKEYYLFLNEKRDSNMVKRGSTRVIGHELIHQWFGNLVTCAWWDEIYINEAFGSIGGYLGLRLAESNTDPTNPLEYAWEDEYLATQGFSGLVTDGRNTSRPMVNRMNNGLLKVEEPAEMSRQFDNIAYNKAGSVMMMIRAVIGEDQWKNGLTRFLNDNKYKPAGYEELLAGWDDYRSDTGIAEDVYGEPLQETIRTLFLPYFLQMGYPILFINVDYELNLVQVRSQRYLSTDDDNMTPESSLGYKWNVPLIVSENGQERIVWLMNVGGASSSDLDIEFSFTGADLRINPNANVWMRTVFNQEYIDAQNAMAWESDKKLSTHMSASVGRMMNDYRDFVMGSNPSVGHINFGNLMDLTTLVKGETDNEVDLSANRFIVWSELSATMDRMLKLLANLDDDFNKDAFIEYLDQTIDPYLDEYYPDKVPNQEGSYLKKKARTSPYIVNMALATQNVNFLTQSDDLIKPVQENVLNDPIFNANSVFDVKYYEFSPDNRDATFQAALLQNNDYSTVIMQAIIEEVSYDGKLMPKPIDGRDIYICVSSFGVWDDCLAQKYVKFLS